MTETQKQKLELLRVRFLEWLKAINYSRSTITNYSRDVRIFLEWLIENANINSISEVTSSHLQQYQIAIYNFEYQEKKDSEKKRLSV